MSFEPIVQLGFDKYGHADFRITMTLQGLSFEKMQALRAMTAVAIGQAEQIWARRPGQEMAMQEAALSLLPDPDEAQR